MNKLPCHIMKDLLPLYVDEVLSKESTEDVQCHLDECESCREAYRLLTKELILPTSREIQEADSRMLRSFKSKWNLKKIIISAASTAVTLALVLLLFVLGREFLFDASNGILAPTIMRAYSRIEMEDGWTRLAFKEDDRWFRKAAKDDMTYLEFGSLYEKEIVNSGNNLAAVELRILNAEGNIVVEPFTVEAGRGVLLPQLEKNTPYIVEIRGDGFFEITFS